MFELSEEQLMVKDMCRGFAEKELREQAVEIDKTHKFPLETTRKLGELGIMGVVYPEPPYWNQTKRLTTKLKRQH